MGAAGGRRGRRGAGGGGAAVTSLVLLGVVLAVVVLIMRRRGRVFLEMEEGYVLGLTFILCTVQKISCGNVSLSDVFVTPFYLALVVCAGHVRGPAQGAVCGFFSALIIGFSALVFAVYETGLTLSAGFPLQYIFLMVMWMILGGLAGLREIPKALKPLLSGLWILFVAVYSPQFLRNLSAYVILFGAVALSALGLYLNLFKRRVVPTVAYPAAAPARRSDE